MKYKMFLILSLLALLLSSCTQNIAKTDLPLNDRTEFGDYIIRILILRSDSDHYLEPYQHFKSTIHTNVDLNVAHFNELQTANNLNSYDIIYPDYSILTEESFDKQIFAETITSYVAQGGHVILEHPFYELFSQDFLGVEAFLPITNSDYKFTYPELTSEYQEIQGIYKEFIDSANKSKLFSENAFKLDVGAKVSNAISLVNVDDLSLAFNNTYELGNVTWLNKIALNRDEYITRLDFQKTEDTQSHFHFGHSSLSWLLRNKLINIAAINKYGFALEKVMGPYTRPGMSWQNHFEEYSGFRYKDMIRFAELLKDYQQIPSYSLIRGTYQWGKWRNTIAVHLNKNNNEQPEFTNYLPNSFYGSGDRISYSNGKNLDFGLYPGYKTLMSELELPTRAYVQIGDVNHDNKHDMVVGDYRGYIYALPNISEDNTPKFDTKIALRANGKKINHSYAAPTLADLNGDGNSDLIIGDKYGNLTTYLNTNEYEFKQLSSFDYDLGEYLAPHLQDFNMDGVLDLIVGNDQGEVYLLSGIGKNSLTSFAEPIKILTTNLKWVAPHVYDYNNDNQPDLLLGSYNGKVALYLNENGTLSYKSDVEGHNYSIHGSKNINLGHNTVPYMVDWNNDGATDLIIGGLEYGPPYAIDDPNLPIRNDVLKNIKYAQDNYLPLDLHIYEHAYKSSEEELEEYKLHLEAFSNLGISTEEIGINHHTWTTNKNTLQNVKNQKDIGAFYNFGFRPFGSTGSPRDSISFAPVIAPFQLIVDETENPFIYWCPAPYAYPQSVRAMINYDLPLTFFEHVECRLNKGTKYYNSLVNVAETLKDYQTLGDYNFMTERQIAKSLMNMYYTDLAVSINNNSLSITPITEGVPEFTAEYKNTLGIRFIPGSDIKGESNSNALIQNKNLSNNSLYLGVNSETIINWNDEKFINENKMTILKSNVPVELEQVDENHLILKLNSTGMQQLAISCDYSLDIKGEDLIIDKSENTYTITHYGDICEVNIKLK